MKTDPWHTLTVTGLHYHNDPTCPGHTHPDGDTCDDEIERELEHPDDCAPWGEGADYRCATDQEVYEFATENEMPKVPGTYRVRGWYTGPDYWGEYDSGADYEDVDVPAAPTEPPPCKRDPWPRTPPPAPIKVGDIRFELVADGEPS